METKNRPIAGRALVLGIAGGLRSFTPLAAVVATHDDAPSDRGWRRWPVLRGSLGRKAVTAMAAAELVGDKLPGIPSRLSAPALLGRVGAAALAGAALGADARPGRALRGAVLAGAGAVVGAVGGYWCRRAIVGATSLPDTTVALLEDAAAIALSRSAAQR